MNKLMNEMENQKELLLTYEQTLSHKDSIVANITNAIQKQVCYISVWKACIIWTLTDLSENSYVQLVASVPLSTSSKALIEAGSKETIVLLKRNLKVHDSKKR